MRKSFVALLLLLGAAASMSSLALAQVDDIKADLGNKLVNARQAQERISRAARQSPARIAAVGDSIWIGHSIQTIVAGTPSTYSYGPFHVGRGDNRPGIATGIVGNSGVWTWDHFVSGESDSLQGWWPMRRAYGIAVAQTASDVDRPWWAIDIGNQGNYVLPSAQGRTFGVISYWHVDGGSSATQTLIPGTNALPMTWAPLNGAGSAWCGLRAHGDITYSDPLTTNPYNMSVLEYNGETGGGTAGGGIGTNKKFPGYPSQMDQLLYRDVEMTSSAATLTLNFNYQTAMSTLTVTTLLTRTGWFQFDPTKVGNVSVAGPNNGMPNYISNTGIGQPADSFMVYLGVPVDNSAAYLADGTNPPVYDLKRRWLSEVIALDKPISEVFHVSGNNNTSFSLSPTALAAFYNAQGSSPNKYLRIVLRAKSNRGNDDQGGSVVGAFSSGGKGMVMVDDVTIGGTNLSGGAIGTSTFNSVTDIDNGVATDVLALGAWRATGKPPAVFFHTHPLSGGFVDSPTNSNLYASLTFQDICGPPTAAARFCNMRGVVISMGDHDQTGEPAGGVVSGTPERERMDGMVSPTIILANAGNGAYNGMGIDLAAATTLDDYYGWWDIYTGVFNLFFTGNAYTFGFQSYPGRQNDGVLCWGDIRIPGFQIFNPDIQCYQEAEAAKGNGLIRTTLSGSKPDSMRLFLGKNQQCFRFAVTGAGCSSTGGAYWDNVSVLFSDATGSGGGGGASIAIDIWRWINDTFPVNDGTASLPVGYAVAPGSAGFDTAAAQLKTGINIAQSPGDHFRFDIPGDSIIVIGDVVESTSGLGRVDMVFRIKPGVGNYHTIGDPTSGLRPVPTDATNIVTSGDGSFWGQYLANPGYMSQGVHGPGNFWNKNVWNSARMDTADVNIWPVAANPSVFDAGVNFAGSLAWEGCYHEGNDGAPDDADQSAKYNAIGTTRNICFLDPNPLGAVNSTNIICPGAAVGNINTNYANPPLTTKENSKIIPDGLLTPGAHVEYFLRGQEELTRNDAAFVMVPETTFVNPQNNEGSTDGHRWQQFGVLPDRWKDTSFNSGATPGESGAQGMACMLYVDLNDRRGNERAWVSIADSIGATASSRRGNHNGWRARGDQTYTTSTGDAIDISGDATIARYDHGGQPGTTWDMYGVKASESLTTSAGALGSRAGQQADGLATGKDSKMGPTPEMLAYYYKVLLILTGDLNSGILGRFTNRGQDDVKLLKNYMLLSSAGSKRAVIIGGDGFVQSEYATGTGPEPDHLDLLANSLGVTARLDPPIGGTPQYSYQPFSGNFNQYVDLISAGPIAGNVYSVGNACLWGNDVLAVVVNSLGAQESAFYQNFGSKGPYVAGVYTPLTGSKFYESYVDGWDTEHLFTLGGLSSNGRLVYYAKLFTQIAGVPGLCTIQGVPTLFLDVPPAGNGQQFVDFVQVRNNPMLTGRANVHFGLAKADRVTARVFDVSGRLVRTLADRNFPAGEYDLYWDGTDDGGRQMERGVYFTQVKYAKNRFSDAKKLTVLR